MYLTSTPQEEEAFRDLEILSRSKKSFEFDRHPTDVQTEYNIYKKSTKDLQQKLAELEAAYSIVCEHSVKLETALNKTKRDLDQCQKSWLTALLMRLKLMK